MRSHLLYVLAAPLVFLVGLAVGAEKEREAKRGPALPPPRTDKADAREKDLASKTTPIGGKNFDQWVKELQSRDPSVRENASRTILLFGPPRASEALPDLIKAR